MFTEKEKRTIPKSLSTPRFRTYLQASNQNINDALKLYLWNAQCSAAFFPALMFVEIALRNSILQAIKKTYPNWIEDTKFLSSLNDPKRSYSQRKDFQNNIQKTKIEGHIVASLNFIFWEKMLNSSFDNSIWNNHFNITFPNIDITQSTVQYNRKKASDLCRNVRLLRNRIAHHEPIFNRDLTDDFENIKTLLRWVNPEKSSLLEKISNIHYMLYTKPKV